MRKVFRIAAWTLGILVVLTLALFVYLRKADLTVYEEQVERYASRAIGHELDIGGRFELQFGGHTRLVAEDVSLSNPDWPTDTQLLRVGHLTVVVDTWSLIGSPLVVEELDVRDVEARVELMSDRRSNWDTGAEPSAVDDDFDSDRIAFRRVQIDGIEFSYLDPDRPRPIDVVIETLTLSPDAADILDLDVQGTINELPLWADGRLGPWQNFLDGRDIIADLDLTLGAVRLSIDGSAEDLPYLQGIVAAAQLTGPDIGRVIDRLGLPPFAEGPFEINADIARIDGGHRVNASGNLGAIDVVANGSIDRFIATENAQLDFSIAGPNIRYLAELLGADDAPQAPFRVAGDLSLAGQVVTFSETQVSVGLNTASVNGEVDFNADFPDLDLSIAAEGPDFSVIGPFAGLQGLPQLPFVVEGNVRKDGAAWQANGVEAAVGDYRVSADGSLTAGSRDDSTISFRAVGPDISILHDFTDLRGLPARPFDVTATIRSHPDGVAVEQATGLFGDNRLDVAGVVATDEGGLAGTELTLGASGPELGSLEILTGVPYLPAGAFDISGQVRLEEDALQIDRAEARVGDLVASGFGEVGLAGRAGQFKVSLTLNGPDAAQFGEFEALAPFAGQGFSVTGGIARADTDLELTEVSITVGDYGLTADGALSMSPMSNDSDLQLLVVGPSLKTLGRMFGSDLLVDKAFEISTEFRGQPKGFAVRNLVAQVGEDDINGEFTVDLGTKPRITGKLTSSFLDLSERLRSLVEAGEETEAPEPVGDALVFSDAPIDTAALQSADIDIDVQVARLKSNTIDVTDFRVGLRLQDGALEIDPISMSEGEGSFSGRLRFVPVEAGYSLDTLLTAQNLHLGLTATQTQNRATLPPISGKIELRGAGPSLHGIMGSANGVVSVRQGTGKVKEFIAAVLFRDVVLEALRNINPLRTKETERTLNCAIYEIKIVDGVANLEQVAMQTDQLLLAVTGSVNLGSETLDLNFRAKPREGIGISLGTLANSFLAVRGTLSAPRVTLDPKGSATATGAAVATGGLSLLARGLWDRLSASKDICEQPPAAESSRQREQP
jgi:uncharacterized protein involved in outer membrane biogenesis